MSTMPAKAHSANAVQSSSKLRGAYYVPGADGTNMIGPLLLKQMLKDDGRDAENGVNHATTLHAKQNGFQIQDRPTESLQVYALVSKETKTLSEIQNFSAWDGETVSTTRGQQWIDRKEAVRVQVMEKIIVSSGSAYLHTMKNNRKQSISVESDMPQRLLSLDKNKSQNNKVLLKASPDKPSVGSVSVESKFNVEKSSVKDNENEETARTIVLDSNSRVSTFLPLNANVAPARPRQPPPDKPPPVVPPPRSASLQHKPEPEEEPDEFVPELLSLKKLNESSTMSRDSGKEVKTKVSDQKRPEHLEEGDKQTISLPVRAVSTSGPHFFNAHGIDFDFKKKISSKSSEPLPGDEEDDDLHKNKRATNPLKKFFARKKGKYDPTADSDSFESTLPSFDSEKKDTKPKKKNAQKKKSKDKDRKKAKNSEPVKAKISKDNIVVVKSSGKCLSDLNFTLDGPDLDAKHRSLEKQNSSSDGGSDLIQSMEKEAEDDYNEMDESIYANFPTVLRRKVGSGHRVDPPRVPSSESSESDPENEYNEPDDNDDDEEEKSSENNDTVSDDNGENEDVDGEDDEEDYVNTLLLAKMNKSTASSKSPSSVTSEGSSTNSGHQDCYVINTEDSVSGRIEVDLSVCGVEDDQALLEELSCPKAPSGIELKSQMLEPNTGSTILTNENNIKRFGTMKNLSHQGDGQNQKAARRDDGSVLSLKKGLEDVQVVDGSLNVKEINSRQEQNGSNDGTHLLKPGTDHIETFLVPASEAHLIVKAPSLSDGYVSSQKVENEPSKVANFPSKQDNQDGINKIVAGNKPNVSSTEMKTTINVKSSNVSINSPRVSLEQNIDTSRQEKIESRQNVTQSHTQSSHGNVSLGMNINNIKIVNAEKEKSIKVTETKDILNVHANEPQVFTLNTPKPAAISPEPAVKKPAVPPPTMPKPPSWKMKELISTGEHHDVGSTQPAPKTPTAKLTSRGSEESINKTLIAGALKELDEFIDNEIKQESVTKERDSKISDPRLKDATKGDQSGGNADYEKFIVAYKDNKSLKNADIPDVSLQNKKLPKEEITKGSNKSADAKFGFNIIGSDQPGSYERVISCSVDGNVLLPSESSVVCSGLKPPSVTASIDRGYEDVLDNISGDNFGEGKEAEEIYDEIGDANGGDLSPTSRCFKFNWKRKDKEQSIKREDSDHVVVLNRTASETNEKKLKEVKSQKTKEEGRDRKTSEKSKEGKRKKKSNGSKTSKKDSKRDKRKNSGDGGESDTTTSSSTSDSSEDTDYEVFDEGTSLKVKEQNIDAGQSHLASPDQVDVKFVNPQLDKVKLINADSYGYEIPAKMAVQKKISENEKAAKLKLSNKTSNATTNDSKLNDNEIKKNKEKQIDINFDPNVNFSVEKMNEPTGLQLSSNDKPPGRASLMQTEDRDINMTLPQNKIHMGKFESGTVSLSHGTSLKSKTDAHKPNAEMKPELSEHAEPVHDTHANVTLQQKVVKREKVDEPALVVSPEAIVKNKLAMFPTHTSAGKKDEEKESRKDKKEKKRDKKISSSSSISSSSHSSSSSDDENNKGEKGKKKGKKLKSKITLPGIGYSVKPDAVNVSADSTFSKSDKGSKEKVKHKKSKENESDESKKDKKGKDYKEEVEKDIKENKDKEKKLKLLANVSDARLKIDVEKTQHKVETADVPKKIHDANHPGVDMKINADVLDGVSSINVLDAKKTTSIPVAHKPPRNFNTSDELKVQLAKRHEKASKGAEVHLSADNAPSAKVGPFTCNVESEMKLPTSDAVSSVLEIPCIQSLSEMEDDPWKDYSALEFGGLTKSKEMPKAGQDLAKNSDQDINWMIRATDTADRTTSLPPDHVAPPVPRVRSKIGLANDAVDLSKLPHANVKLATANLQVEAPTVPDIGHDESDAVIYADGTSEPSQGSDASVRMNIPSLSLKLEQGVGNGKPTGEDSRKDNTEESTQEVRHYDQVPVRMRKLVNAKPVFPGLVVSASTSPTSTSPTVSGAFNIKRNTKGPHSGGPEYAQPWEEKKLDTLAPSTPLSSAPLTVSSRSSSAPSSDIDSFSGARMSYTSEDMNEEMQFGIGDPHKVKKYDPNTKTLGKHKTHQDDGKKGNRLRSITSLFHRKKKEKKDTGHSGDEDDEDDDESVDEDNTSDAKDKTNDGKLKSSKSDKSKARKGKAEKPKKNQKTSKNDKNNRLSQEVEPENFEMMEGRPLCRLIKVNDDGSRVLEMLRPQSEPLGIFFKKGPETHKDGLVVKSFLDKYAKRLFAGLLRVGDEIVEIDEEDICHLTLDEIKDLIQQKESMVLTLKPTEDTR